MLVDLHFLLPLAPARHIGVHDQVLVNVSQGDHLLFVREGGGRGGGKEDGHGPGRRGGLGEGGAGGAPEAPSQWSTWQPGQVMVAGHP